MARFFLTSKAVNDLSSIWEYTFETLSENQADKYYRGLLDDCAELAKNQDLGKNYPEITGDIFGFRSGQHIIFYRKITESEIEITRILHSKMDLKNRIHE
jgi:toxin ParE1/3/4